jgi:transposase
MRKTHEIIRLSVSGLADRAVARACGVSPTTVGDTVRAAKSAELYVWPLPELGDSELRERLFGSAAAGRSLAAPDFEKVDRQLRAKHVTLQLLWEDYRTAHPDGYSYSRFCELYRRWRRQTGAEAVMRFEHRAGETLFVDWAGAKVPYLENGIEEQAAVFVAVLGASDYIYAGVYRDMTQRNWLQAHVDAFAYIGGVPEKVVPDNPRTAVSRACCYDPDLNPAYQELAEHYAVAVIPARPGKPRDKAKAENAVRNVGQQVIARLRGMQLLSFGQLRSAVRKLVDQLNRRPFSKREGSRRSLFEEVERAALKPLPPQSFSRGEWKKATVFKDYHIELNGVYYSVPSKYIGARVQVRLSGEVLEIYHDGVRIAVHPRTPPDGKRASTLPEHMPTEHRAIMQQTARDYLEKAGRCGANCRQVTSVILGSFPRPEMGFRSCQGILRLAQQYGHRRTEQACMRSLEIGSPRYRTISNMLTNGMEQEGVLPERAPIRHRNVRGSRYYKTTGGRR